MNDKIAKTIGPAPKTKYLMPRPSLFMPLYKTPVNNIMTAPTAITPAAINHNFFVRSLPISSSMNTKAKPASPPNKTNK